MRFFSALFSALLLSASVAAHAEVISSYTTYNNYDSGGGQYGQGFTVGGSGTYNSIAFSFVPRTGGTYAVGTGYLFDHAYTGDAAGLPGAGALGSALAAAGAYTFTPTLTLTAGNTYFLYEDAYPTSDAFGIQTAVNPSTYYYGGGGSNFTNFNNQADYIVTGTPAGAPAPTPEPSGLALIGTGLLSVAGFARRRFAGKTA